MPGSGLGAARVGLLASVVVTGSGTFLPFAASGERARSSFELVSLAHRLDLVPDRWPGAATRVWFALPLLLVVCWLLVVTDRATAGAWCSVAASAVAGAGLAAVGQSPLTPAVGWWLTLGGTVGLFSSAAVMLAMRRERRGGP
jgi:hypothetical protein